MPLQESKQIRGWAYDRAFGWLTTCAALVVFLPFLLGASGCPNAYSEFAKKDSDEALLFNAKMLMDKRDYDGAITSIQAMTTEGKAKRDTKLALGSAYAGSCGLELIDFAETVADGTTAGQKLFEILLSSYKGALAAHMTACLNAEASLLAISASASERTVDENVLMAFVEFSKIGTILAQSGADAGDDGVVDGSFDSCTANAANITDDDVKKIGTGITVAMTSLSGTSIAGDVATTFTAMCSTVDTLLGTTGFCDQTTESDFDATEVKGLRALIKSSEIGFNTCGGAVGSSLACVCP